MTGPRPGLPADNPPGDTPPFLPGVPKLTEEEAVAFRLPLVAGKADSRRAESVADNFPAEIEDSFLTVERAEAEESFPYLVLIPAKPQEMEKKSCSQDQSYHRRQA